MTTEELQRELDQLSLVFVECNIKLNRANETIKGLEATIGSLHHERKRERAEASRNWDALSNRIARLEEAGDAMAESYEEIETDAFGIERIEEWRKAKEAKP